MSDFFNVLALIFGAFGALFLIVWVLGVVFLRDGQVSDHEKGATFKLALLFLFVSAVFFVVSRQG